MQRREDTEKKAVSTAERLDEIEATPRSRGGMAGVYRSVVDFIPVDHVWYKEHERVEHVIGTMRRVLMESEVDTRVRQVLPKKVRLPVNFKLGTRS